MIGSYQPFAVLEDFFFAVNHAIGWQPALALT